MKTILAIIAIVASAFLAGRAMLLQFTTIATNDPHKYQPVLKAGLACSIAAIALALLFVLLAKGRWRLAASLPLALCVMAWWGIARMWPYVFS